MKIDFQAKLKLTLACVTIFCGINSSAQERDHYPKFSWDKVPVAFHFGKSGALLTAEEAKFVATRSNFVCLEKGHGSKQFKHTEDAIEQEARQLKKLNPEMKVIFYWNTFLDYPMFRAHDDYQKHPEWWLKKTDGELDLKQGRFKRYDLSNKQVRKWWVDVAHKAVVQGSCDGVFMDAFPQVVASANKRLWGSDKYQAIQQGLVDIVEETREKLGDDQLIVYNGVRSTPPRKIGNDFMKQTDAVMIEHFGHFRSDSKECILADMEAIIKAGKAGKIVVVKAWPGFSWLDKDAMKKPLEEKRKLAAKNITFPLAAFLVAAQEHAYFIYSWGYVMDMGCLEWYPEFDQKLGPPLADAVKSGWEFKREFKHASVWVDLEKKQARIDWK